MLPEVQEYFTQVGRLPPEGQGYDDLERSLADPTFRARFMARHQAATFAVTILKGSEKSNVIRPEASARIDCRMLAGDDPEEIRAWVIVGGGR